MKKSKVETTHLEKVLFPKSKITKGDMLAYYEKIADRMIPLIKDRPLTMHRFPNGIAEEGFFQKNISGFFPKWIKTASIERKEEKNIKMVLCNDLDTLIYIANLGCITPHVWPSKVKKPNYPDRMIFDLDPAGKSFKDVIDAARDLKEILEGKLGLTTFIMTTGSKGLHIVVPIKPQMTFDEVREFAKNVAKVLTAKEPKKYTTEPRKESRKGRLFIDYLRNGYGQMAVAPYALRAIEKAPVATPILWEELSKAVFSSQSFTMGNISGHLKKKCPWENMDGKASSLKPSLKLLEKLCETKYFR